eukprot:10841625-Ditylum_brightwellii.AAC.1
MMEKMRDNYYTNKGEELGDENEAWNHIDAIAASLSSLADGNKDMEEPEKVRYLETTAVLSLSSFITTVLPAKWSDDDLIPKYLLITFWYPCYGGNKMLVFIQAGMPHCIKQIVNTFEQSGQDWKKTDLVLRGKRMSLQMIRKLW